VTTTSLNPAWSHLGVEPELPEIAENREVFRVTAAAHDPPPEVDMKNWQTHLLVFA